MDEVALYWTTATEKNNEGFEYSGLRMRPHGGLLALYKEMALQIHHSIINTKIANRYRL
jgi:hypothetical protein